MFSKKFLTLAMMCAFFGGMIVFSGCGGTDNANQNNDEEISVNDRPDTLLDKRASDVKQIFYTIPSPMEMASLIRKSGAAFDKEILNDVNKSGNYATSKEQAMNLGVYGADLSYTTMFDQQQESIYYLSAARGLAKDLGVEDAIDNKIIERVNDNRNNRDSLMHIVSDAYWSLNGYLKEGGREEVSALVIAGGWIEALYLASTHVSEGNDELKKRIAEQKYSLKDLINLLESYDNAEDLQEVLVDLKEIQGIFNSVEIKKGKTETSKDENGTMVIGGASTIDMPDETLQAIVAKIHEVRSKYIQ